MKVENFLKIRVPIYSKARNYYLGKGVKLYTDEVCDAMNLFLYSEFEKDPSCLVGDIRSLLARKAEIDEKRLGEKTYREYLLKKARNRVLPLPKRNE